MSRPTAVTVFGVLNLVFAGLSVFAVAHGILQMYLMRTMFAQGFPGTPQINVTFTWPRWAVAWAATGFALQLIGVIWKLVSGIGLLKMKPWARRATIGYGIYGIVVPVVGAIGGIALITTWAVRNAPRGPNATMDMGPMMLSQTWSIGGPLFGCMGLVYPALLIYFMTRNDVRMAFATTPAVVEAMISASHQRAESATSRPTPITVLGIFNIVWGALSLVGNLLGIASLMFMPTFLSSVARRSGSGPMPSTQVFDLLRKNPLYAAWTWTSIALRVLAAIILVISGIGLLQMRPWARVAALVYAIFGIVMIIVSSLIGWLYFMPMMNRATGMPVLPPFVLALSSALGVLFALIYPVVLTVYMTRPWLVQAFTTIPAIVEATLSSGPPMITEELP